MQDIFYIFSTYLFESCISSAMGATPMHALINECAVYKVLTLNIAKMNNLLQMCKSRNYFSNSHFIASLFPLFVDTSRNNKLHIFMTLRLLQIHGKIGGIRHKKERNTLCKSCCLSQHHKQPLKLKDL